MNRHTLSMQQEPDFQNAVKEVGYILIASKGK